ncbi:TetR/AcrR family transcriptional regulator [bacterium]|nr:TetR/AcrR family transcriptional regulator [bacterium]
MGRNKKFKREEVLEKCIDLFWSRGYADASLKEIEQCTGVNKSGLYAEFESKENLFLECLKYYTELYNARSVLDRSPSGWKNIVDFLYLSVRGKKTGCFLVNTLREWELLPANAKKYMKSHMKNIRDSLQKNITAEKLPAETLDVILTFNSGLALSMNILKKEEGEQKVSHFLKLLV